MMNASIVKKLVVLLGTLAIAAIPVAACAQAYPTKPIRLIVPFAPGGNLDAAGRLIAEGLKGPLGQPIVVENKGGAGGNIGADAAAKSLADGYTLLLASSALTINPAIYEKVPYDIVKDFEPVGLTMVTWLVLVASQKLGIHSVAELVAEAKAKPGKLTVGSAGVGSGSHLAAELFNQTVGVQTMHVPYKGSGPATTAVMAGEVDLTFTSQAGALPFYKSQRIVALAITGKSPSALFPGVPTIDAAGVKNYEAGDWIGILAPVGTPKSVITHLNSELAKWLNQGETKARLAQLGFEAKTSTPEEFGALIRSELVKWNRTAKSANIKAE
jgi:tripartite-type tricarboxylate transporter receptor subunit TctC